jgi:hypothetical protein
LLCCISLQIKVIHARRQIAEIQLMLSVSIDQVTFQEYLTLGIQYLQRISLSAVRSVNTTLPWLGLGYSEMPEFEPASSIPGIGSTNWAAVAEPVHPVTGSV